MQNDTQSNVIKSANSPDGNMYGQASDEKVGFFGTTPIVQPSSANQAAVGTAASITTAAHGFATGTQADAIVTLVNEMRTVLVNLGLMKGSA